ncbi:MAG: hypothetical protein MJE77_47580, partial [Proteobacteria bacterium]|nr:hypothetical protein [Pseudomonadota bacterium]
ASTKASLHGASLLASLFTGATSFVADLAKKVVRGGTKALGGVFRRFRRPGAAKALPAGRASSVVVNRLRPHEAAFAREIVAHRGGTFIGATVRNLPGIDGYLNGVAVSLKQTQGGLGAVLRHASKAEASAAKAGFSGVEVFIQAPNVSAARLLDFARGGGLSQIPTQGTVSAINVFTGNGVVRIIGAM